MTHMVYIKKKSNEILLILCSKDSSGEPRLPRLILWVKIGFINKAIALTKTKTNIFKRQCKWLHNYRKYLRIDWLPSPQCVFFPFYSNDLSIKSNIPVWLALSPMFYHHHTIYIYILSYHNPTFNNDMFMEHHGTMFWNSARRAGISQKSNDFWNKKRLKHNANIKATVWS